MFNAVDAYARLDLGRDSELVRSLLDRLPGEGDSQTIVLTGAKQMYDGRQPGLMTPAMASWYMEKIAGARAAAISEVNSGLQGDAAETGAKSIYLEMERDSVRAKTVSEAVDEADRFAQQHGELLQEYDRSHTEYHKMRAGIAREAQKPRTGVYVLALFILVVLEAFINFESFLRVPYITSPFLATGATLAVAVAIGFAGHHHGIVLKQWAYYFSPHGPDDRPYEGRRADAVRRLVIGAVLLTVGLLLVAGSRYYYLKDYILQARILGTAAPSMLGGIAFMLFGNLIAYIAATLISYSLHDPNPHFAERYREFVRLSRELEKLKTKRRAAQALLLDGQSNALTRVNNQDNSTRGFRYAELRQQAARIDEKDQEVTGLLLSYRASLVQKMQDRADQRIVKIPDGAYDDLMPKSRDTVITPAEYAARPLSLGYVIA